MCSCLVVSDGLPLGKKTLGGTSRIGGCVLLPLGQDERASFIFFVGDWYDSVLVGAVISAFVALTLMTVGSKHEFGRVLGTGKN